MVRVVDAKKGARGPVMLEGPAAARAEARLKRAGIPCCLTAPSSKEQGYSARYTVRVRQLAAEWIRYSQMGGTVVHEPAEAGGRYGDGLHQRLEKAAVRALYTLGAGEGEVAVVARAGRRYRIEAIRISGEYGRNAVSVKSRVGGRTASPATADGGEADGNLLIGMDPEFVLMRDGGELVHASEYLPRGGPVGCDAVRFRGEVIYPLAELRPSPKGKPEEVFRELQKALRQADALIGDRTLAWRAGALPHGDFPLGGHLHFSGVPLTMALLQALDNYLALPLALLEDPKGQARRPRYGFLGDFRRQPHGGFEYRTLPSFLVSPLVAKATVAIAYLAAKYCDRLPARPLHSERYHRAYYEGDKAVLKECLPGWHRDLAALPEFAAYEEVIAKAMRHIAEGRTWDETRDIRPLWNIPSMP